MSDFPYDPTTGRTNYSNSPYQFWKGSAPEEAGGKVEFVINDTVYTVTIEADGSWEFQLPLRLMDGLHNLTLRYIDVAMNYGAPIQAIINVDTTPPDQPKIQSVIDDVGTTMPLSSGQITDDTRPTLVGFAEPGSTVRLFDKTTGELLGSAVASNNGRWVIEEELGYGQHEVYVTATDRHNQTSEPSESWVINIKDPDAPPSSEPYITSGMDSVGAAQGELAFGAVTDDNRPTLKGMAEPGGLVYLFVKNAADQWLIVGSTRAESNGNWSIETTQLNAGQYDFQVSSSDVRNPAADIFRLTIAQSGSDTLKPVIIDAWDDSGAATGALANGAITDDRTPTLRGTAEANSIVYIHFSRSGVNWEPTASVQANAKGEWTFTPNLYQDHMWDFYVSTTGNLADRDVAGAFKLDVKSGNALKPVIVDAYDDSGTATGELANGATTDDLTPMLRGTAEANSIVYIHARHVNGTWVVLGSSKAGIDGQWEHQSRELKGGSGLYEFQAGSSATRNPNDEVFTLNIQSGNALKPIIVDAYDDSGTVTGALANGAITNDSTPTLRGTAEANSIVYIRFSRSGIDWEPMASVKANAKGEWSFTPELYQDHTWDFYVSSSTTFDYTNRFHIKLDTTAGSPVIEGAWDNTGTGKLVAHNGYIKDTTPEMRGTAEPGSRIIVEFALNSDPWSKAQRLEIIVPNNGSWSAPLPQLANNKWDVRAKAVDAAGNESGWSSKLTFTVDSVAPQSPVITSMWDNAGSLRELGYGDFTNDRTPEIRGTAEPNSTIIVVLAKGNEGWGNGNRYVQTSTDKNGNWKVTIPAPDLTDGRWYFRARAVDAAGNTSELSTQTAVEVRGNLIDSRTVWDFNDGTLQGWTAAGKYAESGQVLVKNWSAPGNSNEAGSYTNGTSDGFSGNVVYRDITVLKGQVYTFSFDVLRLNGHSYAPKLGMTVDGQTVIAQADVGQSWQNRSGTYIANETKTVRVAVTNGQNSRLGNDFAFDNIVIAPRVPAQPEWKTSLETNFDGATLGGWTLKGNYGNSGESVFRSGKSGYFLQFFTAAGTNWSGEVMTRKMSVQAGKIYKFSFDAKEAHQTLAVGKLSFEVDGVTVITPQTLSRTEWNTYEGYFYATSTKVVDIKIKNSTSAVEGNNISLDNIRSEELLNPQSVTGGNARMLNTQEDALLFTPDEQSAALLMADALTGTVQKGVDLTDHGSTMLTVTAEDVLSFGEKDLFIADGKNQLMIKGDASDVVSLDDVLGDSGDWQQQNGTLTVGGVEYTVWQHSGEDAELLIQSGVQTQLS
ncbi:Ig-like domain-containing protein [Duffyella gerundensis]|uniref:Ig-like domain-containing protein n=1 Tax=Duffyella TaxID=3026546 RepID=UPI003F6DFDB0